MQEHSQIITFIIVWMNCIHSTQSIIFLHSWPFFDIFSDFPPFKFIISSCKIRILWVYECFCKIINFTPINPQSFILKSFSSLFKSTIYLCFFRTSTSTMSSTNSMHSHHKLYPVYYLLFNPLLSK